MINRGLTTVGLLALLGTALGCGDLDNFNSAVNVRYAPDGTLVVFAGDAIDLFDPDLSTRRASIPVPASQLFSLSADGSVAAVHVFDSRGDRIELFNIPGGKRLPPVELGPLPPPYTEDAAFDLALSPHGDLAYFMGPEERYLVEMFDTGSGSLLWTSDFAYSPIFSPDGSTVYVIKDGAPDMLGSEVQGFDARTGVQSLDASLMPIHWRLGTMPDPNTLIALDERCSSAPSPSCSSSIEFISTTDGSLIRELSLPPNKGLSGSNPTGLPPFTCSSSAGLCAVVVSDVDPTTMTISGFQQVEVWTMTGTLVQTVSLQPNAENANDVALSADGQFLAVAMTGGDADVFRISDGLLVNRHRYSGTIF